MKKLIPVLLMTDAAMIAAGCGVAPSATTRAADESTTMSTTTADQSTATITTSSASSPCVNAAQNGFNEDDTIRNCPTIVDAVAAGKIASQQGIATTSVDSSSLQLDCETPDLRLPSAGNVSIPTDLAATPVCRQFNTECLCQRPGSGPRWWPGEVPTSSGFVS